MQSPFMQSPFMQSTFPQSQFLQSPLELYRTFTRFRLSPPLPDR